MTPTHTSCLKLHDIIIPVYLGWPKEERSCLQNISLNIHIYFNNIPKACINDNLSDTLCYQTLINNIITFCSNRLFKLIEYLCHELFQFIKQQIPSETSLKLEVTKKPPIKYIDHASFCLSDKEDI